MTHGNGIHLMNAVTEENPFVIKGFYRHWNRETETTLVSAIGAGGTGICLNLLPDMSAELSEHLMVIDSDLKSRADCDKIPDYFHLGSGGDMSAILSHRDFYSYLCGGAIPPDLAAFPTDNGVGKIRPACSVLLGYNLEPLKGRIRKLIERIMHKFRGPLPKRLIMHVVFSWGGGTGSALGIAIAALVLDAARSISRTLRVQIIGHCVAGGLFTSVVATPAEHVITLGNTAITCREMYVAQFPDKTKGLCEALSIDWLERPLFDRIAFYDQADSGNRVQGIAEIWNSIAVNIAASQNHPLQALEGSRDINPHMAQLAEEYRHLGPTVIEAQHSNIARIPVGHVAGAYAGRATLRMLNTATQPASNQKVMEVFHRDLATLQLDSAMREADQRLRAEEGFHLPISFDKLSNREALLMNAKATGRWLRSGRPELAQKVRALGRELPRDATQRCGEFVRGVVGQVKSAPELAAVLRETMDDVEDRKSKVQQEVERLAEANFSELHRRRTRELKELATWNPWRKSARAQLRRSFCAMVDAEAAEATLRIYREKYLGTLHALLAKSMERADAIERQLATQQQQIELDLPAFERAIGGEEGFFNQVIAQDEVDTVLSQMATEVPAKMGSHGQLDLSRLIDAENDDIANLVDRTTHRVYRDTMQYFVQFARDLQGFVDHFKLRFKVDEWLAEALDFTLPAKLDVSAVGPANAPLRTYLVGSQESQADLMNVAQRDGNLQSFEYCVGNNPFEMAVRAKVSGVPFCGLPSLAECDRCYHKIIADGRHSLLSHVSLGEATNVEIRHPPTSATAAKAAA